MKNNNKVLLSLLVVTLSFLARAQIDSIKYAFDQLPESESNILSLCDTAFTLWGTDPHRMESLGTLALEKAQQLNSPKAIARAHHILGVSFWARDLYENSADHYFRALSLYEQLGNDRRIADMHLNIGAVFDDLNELDKAKHYELEGLQMFQQLQDSIGIVRALNNLGVLYRKYEAYDSANYFYRKSLAFRKTQNDALGIARTYNNLADNLLVQNQEILLAIEYLLSAKQLMTSPLENNLISKIEANLGLAYSRISEFEKAQKHLSESLSIARRIDSKSGQKLAHQYLKELALKMDNSEDAYSHLSAETELDNEIRGDHVKKQIVMLNLAYENNLNERRLLILENEKLRQEYQRKVAYMTAITILTVAGFIIYVILGRYQRNKQKAELKILRMKQELNSKNIEISSYTLNFIQKHEIMIQLKEQINELKKISDPSTNHQLNKINKIVDETFRSDDDWNNFKKMFNEMHNNMLASLKLKYPDIGNAELKLCALLRMNMNLKESAKILGISPDSVKTARYRLRKKFGLSTKQNLIDFLLQEELKEQAST